MNAKLAKKNTRRARRKHVYVNKEKMKEALKFKMYSRNHVFFLFHIEAARICLRNLCSIRNKQFRLFRNLPVLRFGYSKRTFFTLNSFSSLSLWGTTG